MDHPNANIVYWNFGVNCLYSVGGTQPLYFDQLAAIYSHYTVMKSRIKVTMIPNTDEPFVGGICVDDDSLLAVTELQNVSAATFFPSTLLLSGTLRLFVVSFLGCDQSIWSNPLDNDELRGDVSANPVETGLYGIC